MRVSSAPLPFVCAVHRALWLAPAGLPTGHGFSGKAPPRPSKPTISGRPSTVYHQSSASSAAAAGSSPSPPTAAMATQVHKAACRHTASASVDASDLLPHRTPDDLHTVPPALPRLPIFRRAAVCDRGRRPRWPGPGQHGCWAGRGGAPRRCHGGQQQQQRRRWGNPATPGQPHRRVHSQRRPAGGGGRHAGRSAQGCAAAASGGPERGCKDARVACVLHPARIPSLHAST